MFPQSSCGHWPSIGKRRRQTTNIQLEWVINVQTSVRTISWLVSTQLRPSFSRAAHSSSFADKVSSHKNITMGDSWDAFIKKRKQAIS